MERLHLKITSDAKEVVRSTMVARSSIAGLGREVKKQNVEATKLNATTKVTTTRLAELDRQNIKTTRSITDLGRGIGSVNRNMQFLRNSMAALKWPAMITGAGLATQALGALAGGAAALTGALLPLSGAIAAYPALGLAAAQGIGVMSLAMKDAQKESKALRDEFRLLKEFQGALKREARRGLFPGLEKGFANANTRANRENLKGLAKRTGGALGNVAERAGKKLGSESFTQDLLKQGNRNVKWIEQGGNAAIRLADGLRHVVLAAGPLVGWMVKMGAEGAKVFQGWARGARESGELRKFFAETRRVLEIIGPGLWDFGKAIANIANAGKGVGTDLLRELTKSAEVFRNWTESASGKNALDDYFRQARKPLEEMGKLLGEIVVTILRLGNQPGLSGMLKQIRTEMLPVLEEVIGSTTKAFGPALIDTLTSVVKLFGDLAGTSGPLTIMAKAIGQVADALHWAFEHVPGLQAMTVTALGAMAVGKVAGIGSKMTGLKSLGNAVGGDGPLSKIFGRFADRGASPANAMWVQAVGGFGAGGGKGGNILGGVGKAGLLRVATMIAPIAVGAGMVYFFSRNNKDLPTEGGAEVDRNARSPSGGGNVGAGTKNRPNPNSYRVPTNAGPTKGMKDESAAATAAGAEQLRRRVREVNKDIRAMSTQSAGSLKALSKSAIDNFKKIRDSIGLNTREGKAAVAANFKAITSAVAESMNKGKSSVRDGMKVIERQVKLASGGSKEAMKTNFNKAIDAVRASMKRGGEVTKKGLAVIRGLMVEELKMYGLNPRQAANIAGSGGGGYGDVDANKGREGGAFQARGGLHQFGRAGQTGRDTIPANIGGRNVIVAPGEVAAVLNDGQQQIVNSRLADMGGLPGLFKKYNRPHGMAQGGLIGIPGSPGRTADKRVVPDMVSIRNKYKLLLGDAYAASGHAADGEHPLGLAFDAGPANGDWSTVDALARWAEPSQNAPRDPFRWVGYDGDDNHGRGNHIHLSWEHGPGNPAAWVKTLGGKLTGTLGGNIKRVKVGGNESPLRNIVQGAVDKVRKGANRKLRKTMGTSMGGVPEGGGNWSGGGTAAENRALGMQMAKARGWGGANWRALDYLWGIGESAWDHHADNPTSSAYGIPQAMAHIYPETATEQWKNSPSMQIKWGLDYIAGRYGNPVKALAFWNAQSPHWYKKGGIVGYAGDSLGQGTLGAGGLGGLIEQKIWGNVVEGRSSASGLAAMKGMKGAGQYVFDLGTNDQTAGQTRSSLAAASRFAYPHALHYMTTLGPDAAAKNKMMRQGQGGNEYMIDWAKAAGPYLGADGLHPSGAGYKKRARMIAASIKRVKEQGVRGVGGGGGDSGGGGGGGMPSAFAVAEAKRARDEAIKAYKKSGGKFFGKNNDEAKGGDQQLYEAQRKARRHWRRLAARRERGLRKTRGKHGKRPLLTSPNMLPDAVKFNRLTGQVTELEDLVANRENEFMLDDQLDPNERSTLLTDWRQILGIHQQRQPLAQNLHTISSALAKATADQIKKYRAEVREQVQKIKRKMRELAETRSAIKKIREKKGAPSEADKKQIARLEKHGVNLVADIKHSRRIITGITGQDDVEQGYDATPGSLLGKSINWAGKWGTMRAESGDYLKAAGIPATIIGVRGNIAALERGDGTTGLDGESSADALERLKEEIRRLQRSLSLSGAQFDVFRTMAPLVGKFAHGGTVPATGLALVHRDEQITSDPKGPYGSQFTPGVGGRDAPQVTVVVNGGIGGLVSDIEVMVDGQIAQHQERVERRGRTFARGPGRS